MEIQITGLVDLSEITKTVYALVCNLSQIERSRVLSAVEVLCGDDEGGCLDETVCVKHECSDRQK